MKVRNFGAARVQGFSLVEMIAVLVLIGIIMGVVAPNVLGKLGTGKVRATKAKIAATSSKIEMFALDVGELPQNLQDLVSKPGNAEGWNGPYVKGSDLKDGWNNEFIYKAPGEHGEFDLVSLGADKQPGGDGNNADLGNWE